jgi:hypothetical protein
VKKNQNLRLLWLLFNDCSIRLSIMIDDARSIQTLCLRELSDRKLISKLTCNDSEKERNWALKDSEKVVRTREKAVVDIYQLLESVVGSLESHREQLGTMYLTCTNDHSYYYDSSDSEPRARFKSATVDRQTNLVEFVIRRGFVIDQCAEMALRALQLAREKLQQLIENKPGALPAPLAQRRWANALYVNFLENFNARAIKQVVLLDAHIGGYPAGKNVGLTIEQFIACDQKASAGTRQFHGIGYSSTSWTAKTDYSTKAAKVQQIVTSSSYFYPEQPILLPLLYHEYAHHFQHVSDDARYHPLGFDSAFTKHKSKLAGAYIASDCFSDRADEAQQYCDTFVTELKADVFALAISGIEYLHALFLQIFGIESVGLQIIVESNDRTLQFNEVAISDVQKFDIDNQSSIATISRLFFALEFLLVLRGAQRAKDVPPFDSDEIAFCEALRELCTDYLNGMGLFGSKHGQVFAKKLFLLNHYLNGPVREMARQIASGFGGALYHGARYHDGQYVAAATTKNALEGTVEKYCNEVFSVLQKSTRSISSESFRLDSSERKGLVNIMSSPHKVRWYVSARIEEASRAAVERGDKEVLSKIVNEFAQYFRNDGSVVFRYLLEFVSARRAISMKFAAELQNKTSTFSSDIEIYEFFVAAKHELSLKHGLYERLCRLVFTDEGTVPPFEALAPKKLVELLVAWTSSPICEEITRATNGQSENNAVWEIDHAGTKDKLALLDEQLSKPLLSSSTCTLGCPVGMLDLGSINPFYARNNWYGPRDVFKELHEKQFFKSIEVLNAKLGSVSTGKFKPFFGNTWRSIGDYNYVSLILGTTPVERDLYIGQALPQLQKPRFVVAIGNSNVSELVMTEASEQTGATGGDKNRTQTVRVLTLVKTPYRSDWLTLENFFKKRGIDKLFVFLSTGWETAIVIWDTDTSVRLWSTLKELNTLYDTHSVFLQEPNPALCKLDPISGFKGFGNPDDLNFRTGRYDYGTVLKDLTVDELFQQFDRLDEDAWKEIEKISIEARIAEPSAKPAERASLPIEPRKFEWLIRKMNRHG